MRKFFALIFTLLVVIPLILSALALVSTDNSILDRNFYIQALDNDAIYASLLSDNTIDSMVNEQIQFLPSDGISQIREVIQSVITRAYLQEQVSILANNLFDYLQGKTDSFEAVIDFSPIKTALANERSSDFLAALVAALPVCEPGVLPGIDSANQKACKPEGMDDEVLANIFLQPFLPVIIAQIPDKIPVGKNWESLITGRKWSPFASGKTLQAEILLATILVAFVALSFWYIAALIADDSWRVRLKWLGWSLLIPSAIVFLVGLAATSDISAYWINLGINRIPFASIVHPAIFIEPVRELIRSFFVQMANTYMTVGGISGSFGLGFVLWGLAFSRKS